MQNLDLEKELDEFVRTEELLRKSLDRRSRADEVKQRVQRHIMESENRIPSRSPCHRGYSPHKACRCLPHQHCSACMVTPIRHVPQTPIHREACQDVTLTDNTIPRKFDPNGTGNMEPPAQLHS